MNGKEQGGCPICWVFISLIMLGFLGFGVMKMVKK